MIDSLSIFCQKTEFISLFLFFILIECRLILPCGRADLAASASLQGIRSEGPQLHALCLASAAISTRESPRIIYMLSEGTIFNVASATTEFHEG